ncbi:MAG TPA: CpaF family protein [Candidatus Gracilibacteria bacterium]
MQTQALYKKVIQLIQNRKIESPSPEEVHKLCQEVLTDESILLPQSQYQSLIDQVTHIILGLGPIEPFIQDDEVSEIMVNGLSHIFIERSGKLEATDVSFRDEAQLLAVINRIVGRIGRRIDESTPMVDARLQDGSRVNAIIPPLSLSGPILTIRKFPQKSFRITDMLEKKSLSPQMAEFLEQAIQDKENILISGGTGAGKTSTLNACAGLIPHSERLITIEDSAEIRIDHPHLISLESRPQNLEGSGEISIRQLLKNALRMRPDRIVVGEIRSGEAIDMLQAMNTGHRGSLTTLHANAPLEALFRLETMVLTGGIEMPLPAIRAQIIQGIDLIIQQSRLSDGSRKITEIARVEKDLKSSEYKVQTLFKYDATQDKFI